MIVGFSAIVFHKNDFMESKRRLEFRLASFINGDGTNK